MGVNYDADTFVERANVKNMKGNDMKIMDLFLQAGMAPEVEDKDKITALKQAAANGNFELVKKLVNKGADIAKAMPWAAGHGQRQILDFMLQRNPGKPAINQSLHSVVRTDHIDITQLLLEKGADVNFIDGSTVLIEAVSSNSPNIEQVKLLLSKGADINLKGYDSEPSALFVAASKFNSELVDLLIAHGADVNVKSDGDSTPLHEAIDADDIAPLLEAIKKDKSTQLDEVNLTDNKTFGDDSEQRRLNIVKSLVDKGADLELTKKSIGTGDMTPLLHAIFNERSDIALFLIGRSANVNAQIANDLSRGGWTARVNFPYRHFINHSAC
jgi:ankyrin repeat protein